jgi:1-deoxyxylulose-5-phosphate synthase
VERRILNGTSLEVSRACLGTMTFGAQAGPAESARMLDMALEAGIDFLDTANVYAGGESERLLGEMLGARRKSLVLASKVGMKTPSEPGGLAGAAVMAAAENSLSRLRTDYLDIYYLHTPDYSVCIEETLEAADRLVQQGKVRHVATSNYASWQLCRLLWTAAERKLASPRVAQPMYNLLARRIEDEFLPACRELGVGTVAYNPLAGGLLTGKQKLEAPLPGSRFDGNKIYTDRYWNEAAFQAVGRLGELAAGAGRSLASLALNWLLRHSAVDSIILGASRPEQLAENLAAMGDGPLSAEMLTGCDEVWAELRGPAPKYNR